MTMVSLYDGALAELAGVFAKIDDASVDAAVRMIPAARKIVVWGAGRERLQIMGFAMRLFHMGFNVSVTGDVTTPAIGPGDLFIAACGPGEFTTALAFLTVAKETGADILLVTAQPQRRAAHYATRVLVVPAQTMADDQGPSQSSVLPMGSLFEGSLFVLFEVMVLKLKRVTGISAETMRANHTNLE
jgi:6-phospho-3-hexuloisomerase